MNFMTDLELSRVPGARYTAPRDGFELYYDRTRAHWFDPSAHRIIKSEPVNVKKWLKDVPGSAAEVTGRAFLPQCVAAQS